MGVNGMVTSAHVLPSLAGQRVLADGGTAFDAAVSVASTLAVAEPFMSGPGGIGLALVYVAKEDRVRVLNYSGRAPQAAEPDRFTSEKVKTGGLASLIPGNLAGWYELHQTYGTLDWDRLLEPAIAHARDGLPISVLCASIIDRDAFRLAEFPSSAAILLPNGKVPDAGSRLPMPQLSDSLAKIASGGREVFYEGELAEKIVEANRAAGGLFTLDDLAGYRTEWQDPISIDYRGLQVHTTPPNSSGFQILQTLKIMEGYDPTFQHLDTVHTMMEAVKLAVTDRIRWAGDPDYVQAPLDALLSDGYAAKQRGRIDPNEAAIVSGERYAIQRPNGALTPGSPSEFDGGMTTSFAVADRDGNVVSITQTLGGGFGSALAAGDTGIFLNNMMEYFDLEEGGANLVGPGKRVDFVIAPTQTFKDGKFFASMGTPGSWGILQTTPQFLMNVLDYGMNVQQAVEMPRFRYSVGRQVDMEERFPRQLRLALQDRGHEVSVIDAWDRSVGGAHAIQADHDAGVFFGGADPRRDGVAIPL